MLSKKAVIWFCVLALVTSMAFVVAGCGGEEETPTTAAPTETTAAPTETTAAPTETTAAPTETTEATKTDTLVIGTIMPLTGPLAIPALALTRGWEMYADSVEQAGGVQIGDTKYKIKFIIEDSKATAEGAATAANKLVTQDKVQFIIGAFLEDEIAAINGVTEPAGVLFGMANINIAHHPSDVSPDKPLQVRLAVSADDNQGIVLDYVKANYPDVKKIAIVAPGLGYGSMIDRLKKQAPTRGMEVTFVEEWAWGTTDFVPTMTKVNASNPDLIFAMNSGQANDQLKAVRSLGYKGPFASNSPLGADVFTATVDKSMLYDVIVTSPDVTNPTEAIKYLQDAWAKKWPKDGFISDCIHGNSMPMIFIQAMQRGASLDPKVVMATLESMTTPGDLKINEGDGYMGGLDAGYGVNRVLYRPFPLTVFKDGAPQFMGYLPPVD